MAVPVFVPEADSAPPPAPTQESARISGHTAAPFAPVEGAGGDGRDATPCLQDPSHAAPP
jgi:hypothetical protein